MDESEYVREKESERERERDEENEKRFAVAEEYKKWKKEKITIQSVRVCVKGREGGRRRKDE